MRSQSSRPDNSAEDPATGVLAGIVGHELNNIAVPLDGFAELAIQNSTPDRSLQLSLEEIRIAIGRIKALASDLESLAESESHRARVAVGDCMPDEVRGGSSEAPRIEWLCSAATVVEVDRAHARRAIESLAAIATRAASRAAGAPVWSVSQGSGTAARCIACGAARRRDPVVFVQVYASRPMAAEAFRDPFGFARAGGARRRLTLAVLVHSAHCAGGHILLDEGAGSISLAFPV